ncbi:MAG: type transport system ATP-binding protein [Solirubrobacteraceae bacterium]|nr:heme exporter protein CcmA [Solirubrobacterales bacterium]MEA2216880.1 type transport system ATP-binding protein [Solirubrobacteraceae bacterium]
MSAALRVEALSKSYGGVQALREVSFETEPGELVAVLGPNGAGKTTLLSILAGAQQADSGHVSVPPREVGWAPQQPALYARLTVAENLELFARLERVADPSQAVAAMLAQTGLEARAAEQLGRLSGGNRQRVNVAIALIGDPPVLALDEPSASLDPAQRERLWEFVAALARAGTTVIFSTHGPGEAQRHADRVLVLDGGRVTFDGTPGGLIARAGGGEDDLERALVSFLGGDRGAPA